MADTHPYTTSQGGLAQTITQLRKSFPAIVDAATLKKLGFAPKNESYILNVLRFLGLISEESKKTDDAKQVFSLHDDAEFSKAFGLLVKSAYKDLFDLHGDAAWDLDSDSLIAFFRANDNTSDVVGKRQATTYQLLAAFSGHGDATEPKAASPKSAKKPAARKAKATPKPDAKEPTATSGGAQVAPSAPIGMTVRIEINLPADGDQATYDRIFKSIRENLLNG